MKYKEKKGCRILIKNFQSKERLDS
ncbi:hypothetical protein F383_33657 [Gossypium arboreum]|uniref:Uncharacterized protein n=1 Tax=Gossypium arboreum TaxID=29729 RepID=A0A0B0PNF5_GOSAR|nr:hypothetical protein F383_33657 [Gossypium arboreum]